MSDNTIQISKKLADGTIVVIGGADAASFINNVSAVVGEQAAESITRQFSELVTVDGQFAQATANAQPLVQQGYAPPPQQPPFQQPYQQAPQQQYAPPPANPAQGYPQQQVQQYQQQYAQPEAPRADGPPPGQFCDPKDPSKTKWVPGGTSKKTNKPYAGFWAAP